jgi:hypothetical protein
MEKIVPPEHTGGVCCLAMAQQSDNLWRIDMRQALHLGDAAGG